MDAVKPMDKEDLRRRIGARCRELDQESILSASASIQSRVVEMSKFTKSTDVACYLAAGQEVMTDSLVAACWDTGKALSVPAHVPSERRYRLARLRADTRLVAGPLGIREPADPEWIEEETVGLFLVPGVAFDVEGGRLGHGGGHYDRLLHCERAEGPAYKVGLAFDCQVVAAVPMESLDVRMDAVVTESRVMKAKQDN